MPSVPPKPPGEPIPPGRQLDDLAAHLARCGIDAISLDDLIHDIYSARASAINNDGLRAQLAVIVGEYGSRAAEQLDSIIAGPAEPARTPSDAAGDLTGAAGAPPVGCAVMPWYTSDAPVSDRRALDQIAYWLRDPEWGTGMLEDITAVVARTGRPPRIAAEGTVLLCDTCFEDLTGLLAECQDECSLALDHDGTCGPAGQARYPVCDCCAKQGRLTEVDGDSVDIDPPSFWDRH